MDAGSAEHFAGSILGTFGFWEIRRVGTCLGISVWIYYAREGIYEVSDYLVEKRFFEIIPETEIVHVFHSC